MDRERWQQVDGLYHAAMERPAAERGAFLDASCPDAEIRREVESLLSFEPSDGSVFDGPAWEKRLAPRERIGPYELVARAGAGGMGEVWKARDTRLGRDVAIKVCAERFSDRFRREARAIAALNHPHICTLYDVGADCLVMEYIEGKPLAGPLPLDQALQYAIQIAEALDTAHQKGVVHRDLKPANILVTKSGVKLLDFGLAKMSASSEAGAAGGGETVAPTGKNTILGTLQYMAPEQLDGREADARSDIFSFGAVLYEMLTGRRAFRRDSAALTMAAILHLEPPPLPAGMPPELERVVARCLRKEPAHRFQHMADVRIALEELKEESDSGRLAGEHAPARPRSRRFLRPALAAAAVLVLAAGSVFVWRRVQARPLTDNDVLVLADFTNTTGNSVFDDTLKQGLSVQLEQSPFLSLLSERKVNDTLKLMGRPAGDRLTPEVTREVCQRTSSKAMVAGSIAELGSQYVIGLKAVNCATGDVLAEAQEQAAGKEAVLKALGAAAVGLRSKLGESLSSVEKYATPLAEATTPSLEALKAYSLGIKTLNAKEGTAALPFFQRALDLDPNFAMAYAMMPARGLEAENARKAYALREKVSEWERFYIEGFYYLNATGELEKAAQTADLWQQTYPRDDFPYFARGAVSGWLGNWEKALEDQREALRLEPNNEGYYFNLGFAYMVLNRLDEAEAVYKQAEERKLGGEFLLANRYLLAFLKGDAAQMARLVSGAMGKPGAEDVLLASQADTEGWHGKLKNARELTGRAMDSARHTGAQEAAAAYQATAALREVESGNREQARAEAIAALKLAPNRDVRAMAALALARAGDTAGAEKLAAELDKSFPLGTLVQRYWLPTVRAAVALERKDPNRAIDLLKEASMIELSGLTFFGDLTILPAYVRGEAWLMLHDGNRAAAEFQKFIDHRGLVVNFPWGALARLGLARAYLLQGDTAKARAAYRDFLTLWKDADPDVPILKEAKAEYAKLQ